MKFKNQIAQLLLLGAVSAECPQNKHSVDVSKMPYADQDIHSCQYAGAIQLQLGRSYPNGFHVSEEEADHHLFYWLFKKTDAKEDSPLLFWLNGGHF